MRASPLTLSLLNKIDPAQKNKVRFGHFRRMFYTQIMNDRKVQTLRTVIITQSLVSVFVVLYILTNLSAGLTRVGPDIGGPILLLLVLVQLVVNIVVLIRSYVRPKKTKG